MFYTNVQYWLYWKCSLSVLERVPPSTLYTSSYKRLFAKHVSVCDPSNETVWEDNITLWLKCSQLRHTQGDASRPCLAIKGHKSKMIAQNVVLTESMFFQVHQACRSFSLHPLIMVDYYQFLGVQRDASADEIKKAWVDKVSKFLISTVMIWNRSVDICTAMLSPCCPPKAVAASHTANEWLCRLVTFLWSFINNKTTEWAKTGGVVNLQLTI